MGERHLAWLKTRLRIKGGLCATKQRSAKQSERKGLHNRRNEFMNAALKNNSSKYALAGFLIIVVGLSLSTFKLSAQEAKPQQTEAANKSVGPLMPEAHFHHLHLNTLDPKA